MNTTANIEKDSTKSQPAIPAQNPNSKFGPQKDESVKAWALRVLGDGFYSEVARELMADAMRLLKLSYAQAEQLGRDFQTDMGRYDKQLKASGVGIGKANKDRLVTLRSKMAPIKDAHLTASLQIAKLCQLLQDAMIYGIEGYVDITLSPILVEWLAKSKE